MFETLRKFCPTYVLINIKNMNFVLLLLGLGYLHDKHGSCERNIDFVYQSNGYALNYIKVFTNTKARYRKIATEN